MRINVRMLLSVSVLQQVLHAIEGQMPYLLVRQLLVTKRNWRGRNRPGAKSGNDALDVRMTISGYWYAAAAAAGAG